MTTIMMAAALVLASLAIVSPLAAALRAPGEGDPPRDRYVVVLGLPYPGLTIAGAAEPLAILALCALLVSAARAASPVAAWPFSLVALALAAEALSHGLYWALIAPRDGARLEAGERSGLERPHLCRALAATAAFGLLVAATLAAEGGL